MLLIKNGHIKPIVGEEIPNGCILVDDNGKISAIGTDLIAPDGAQIIDAAGRLVTPGCIDAHCHVGLHDSCLRWEGADYNDFTEDITPQLRAIDSIYPQDEYLTDAIMGGVTSACTGPGSANVVGGTFAVIKMYGKRVDKMIVKSPAAMKCAFGENPKNGKKVKTRMGVAATLRELMFKAKAYTEAKEAGKEPTFDIKLEAMIPVIKGEIPLKCHAHRADDILSSIRIAKEFGVKLTLDHCTDGIAIADELGEEGYPALVGPSMMSRTKPEIRNNSFRTAGVLHAAGVPVCIISDAPVKPIGFLPMYAGLCARKGLPMEEAWKAITINPANVLGVADRLGSLEPGKDADIVIWTANPLTTIGGAAYITIIDGKIVYQA